MTNIYNIITNSCVHVAAMAGAHRSKCCLLRYNVSWLTNPCQWYPSIVDQLIICLLHTCIAGILCHLLFSRPRQFHSREVAPGHAGISGQYRPCLSMHSHALLLILLCIYYAPYIRIENLLRGTNKIYVNK